MDRTIVSLNKYIYICLRNRSFSQNFTIKLEYIFEIVYNNHNNNTL